MKSITIAVSGCRQYDDFEVFDQHMTLLVRKLEDLGFTIKKFILGDACGIDAMAEDWCLDNNKPYEIKYADWDKFGPAAGCIRNTVMIDPSTHLVSFWDGESRGTKHAIDYAMKLRKSVIRKKIETTKKRYYSRRQKQDFNKKRDDNGKS